MPSPFPGMNPYLENPLHWQSFHTRFMVHLADQINPLILPKYRVEIEHTLYIDSTDYPKPFAYADAAVRDTGLAGEVTAIATLVRAPMTLRFPRTLPRKHRSLSIRATDDKTVVTVLELLSPSNKSTRNDRKKYLAKRESIIIGSTNFVEIDLLRGGRRMPARGMPLCDYSILVSRAEKRPKYELWPLRLQEPLPPIPLPLRHGEAEPMMDLKAVLDRVYDTGGYRYEIYNTSPVPLLSAADAEWAAGIIGAGV